MAITAIFLRTLFRILIPHYWVQNCKISTNLKIKAIKFIFSIVCILIALGIQAQNIEEPEVLKPIDIESNDSLLLNVEALPSLPDSSSISFQDTIPSDTLNLDSLTPEQIGDVKTTVLYSAKDSITADVINMKALLYGEAEVKYGDIELKASRITIDWEKNELDAEYTEDSTGKKIGKPLFKEGSQLFEADRIRYNFTTKKGVISGVVTQQGEGFVHGERVMVNEKNESFIDNALYTTCNLPDPHFRINARKIKMIPEKRVVSGPFNLVVNDIPTPLGFAFGLFPIPKEKASGIIVPKYGDSRDRGFFLRDGGYYWAVNDYMGLKFLAEIYTNGSWGGQFFNNYTKRYSFNGDMNFRYNKRIQGEDENRTELEDFWFKWNHTPTQKGAYGGRFSANVSLGSQNFNARNNFNINELQTATFNSQVSYSKNFRNTPFNFSTTLRQSQNTQTGLMDLTLPDVNLGMQRQSPFKKVKGLKKIEPLNKFNFSYSGRLSNSLSNRLRNTTTFQGVKVRSEDAVNELDSSAKEVFTANFASADRLWDRGRFGVQHNIPISTSLKLMKYFNLNPSFNYTEFWYFDELQFGDAIDANSGILLDTANGFSRTSEWNTSANLTTRVYGTFFFNKIKKLEAVRHTIIPTVGVGYKPDFSKTSNAFQQVLINDSTGETRNFSRYNGFVFGAPSSGENANLNFSLVNVLEAKVKSSKDTAESFKKVKILENLSISSGYNFAAESFNFSSIAISARTQIGPISLNTNITVDPYIFEIDSVVNGEINQTRVQRYFWNVDGYSLGDQVRSYQINASTNLNPQILRGEKRELDSDEGTEEELEYIRANPELYVDFTIPWNLGLNYTIRKSKNGFLSPDLTQNLSFNGDVSFTEKWKVGFRSSYDITEREFSTTSISLMRDLHCWQMALSWIPFPSQRASFTFDINVKSSILQDLKLSKRNTFYDR